MISYVYGQLLSVEEGAFGSVFSIDPGLGKLGTIGIQIIVPTSTTGWAKQCASVGLYTHLRMVSDVPTLYGFETSLLRDIFVTALGVSGVVPASAFQLIDMGADEILDRARVGKQDSFICVNGISFAASKSLCKKLQPFV